MKCPESAGGAWLAAVALLPTLSGCQQPLGACDEPAAREVVYGRNGLVATKGQALAQDSCGNGAFCHASEALGSARHGAPREMNFDMLPVPDGRGDLLDLRHESWEQVREGHMPPRGAAGKAVQGDGDWRFSVHREEDSEKLPGLRTRAGKAAFRNWLACGAPVVTETRLPQWAMDSGDAGADLSDWRGVYETILQPNCALGGCHVAASAAGAGGLNLDELCDAYDALQDSGSCGPVRARPGDAAAFLLDKIEDPTPICGDVMPTTGAMPKALQNAVRAWVQAGMPSEDCE